MNSNLINEIRSDNLQLVNNVVSDDTLLGTKSKSHLGRAAATRDASTGVITNL